VAPFGLVWQEEAALALAGGSPRDQRRILDWVDGLKAHPTRPGDYQERDTAGRVNEVTLVGEWLITYWADHAAREVRIVRLEAVED
jgi:hypothetical protein